MTKMISACEQRRGMYDDVAEETGYDIKALQNIKSIADKVESSRRREDLSFSHHTEVASLPPEKQEAFLQKAVDEKLSAIGLWREFFRGRILARGGQHGQA